MKFIFALLLALKFANALILDCTFSNMPWTGFGEVYTCDARILVIGEETAVLGISGDHEEGKTNEDVAALKIANQYFYYVPEDITRSGFFENLHIFAMTNTSLQFITYHDIRNFTDLEVLDLHGNIIETIGWDLLAFSKNLSRLDLSGNSLTNVAPRIFAYTPLLNEAIFSGNRCINMAANSACEVSALALELVYACPPARDSAGIILDCQYINEAWDIVGESYTCDARVIRYTEERSVGRVAPHLIQGQTNTDVTAVRISNDHLIDFLPSGITEFFPNINFVSMTQTSLNIIENTDLQPFPALERLDLNGNRIQVIKGDLLLYSPNLKRIDLSDNILMNVGLRIFQSTPSLSEAIFLGNSCIDMHASSACDLSPLAIELVYRCPPSFDKVEDEDYHRVGGRRLIN